MGSLLSFVGGWEHQQATIILSYEKQWLSLPILSYTLACLRSIQVLMLSIFLGALLNTHTPFPNKILLPLKYSKHVSVILMVKS